jgi:hypothetical protein
MSWLFSQALVEAYSGANCSGGGPFAPLSKTSMPQAYLHRDKTTDGWSLSRYGMTFKPLTADHGEAVLTLYLAAFPVRISARLAKGLGSMDGDLDYGLKCQGSFVKYNQDLSLWKTRQHSLLEGLDVFSETWPQWGTMRNGECWERIKLERRTDEIGSGFWPTPKAHEERAEKYTIETSYRHFMEKRQVALSQVVRDRRMWPTPTLAAQVGGKLNPNWVEWLMGWPIGHTDLKPLETDRFQQWLRLHGRCCAKGRG